jgi:hypothetical protein
MRFRRAASIAVTAAALAGLAIASAPGATAASPCTVGPSLIGPTMPFEFNTVDANPARAFVEFSATNGRGVWAGVAFNGGDEFAILRWAGGHTTVLDRIRFVGFSFESNNAPATTEQTSVEVAGVDASGAVIAAIQISHTNIEARRQRGFRYAGGHKYQLATSPNWVTARPTGVAPDGTIVGIVRNNRSTSQVEQWRGSGSGRASHLTGPIGAEYAAITANHDVAYSTGNSQGFARLATTGRIVHLGGVAGDRSTEQRVMGASSNTFYGASYGAQKTHVVRWRLSATSASPLTGTAVSSLVTVAGVGSNGAVVGTPWIGGTGPDRTSRSLVANGGVWLLPPQYKVPFGAEPPVAVSPTGVAVYTGTDRLPHTYSCTR